MNSIPAVSRACWSRSIVDCFASAPFSMRVTVLAVTPAFLASSRTPQPTAARAIFSCIAFIGTLYKYGFTPYRRCDGTLYQCSITGIRHMQTVSASIGVSLIDSPKRKKRGDRRYFIGGSDARIIMGKNEAALLRLWREKRGEVEPEDLSTNLIVQLGNVTEDLNRRW